MKQELQEKLEESGVELISWLETTAKSTEGFMVEQAPLLIQEVLLYYTWYYGIFTGLGVLLVLFGVFSVYCGIKKTERLETKNNGMFDSEPPMSDQEFCVVGVFFILAGTGVTLYNTLILLKVILAPRLFLLEQLSEILN